MNRIMKTLLAATFISGAALAQLPVAPGTPAQVSQALSEAPAWADEAVELLVSRGIYIGYPDGSFGWHDDITRAELAMVIARLVSSFELEQFQPDELQLLRHAAEQLGADLAGLTALVEQHDQQLTDVAAQLELHEAELARLWTALAALDSAPEVFDATGLWLAISELEAAAAERDEQLNGLQQRLAALEAEADTSELWVHLETLATDQAAAEAERRQLAEALTELQARVAALTADPQLLTELELRLGVAADRLAQLETRLNGLEAGLDAANSTLSEHGERLARLEDSLLPERAPFHLSLALYGSAPDGGLVGQVAIGHDAVVGNLGVRFSTDFGFSEVPISIAAALTYRATMDQVDGYAGLGLGASFEERGTAMFAEMLIGVSYRLARNIGIYAEARFRPYFDGSGDGLAAIGGGVQLRF